MDKLLCFVICFASSVCLKSQSIKAYFNQSVDNSVSSITDAKTSSHLDDTIRSLINSAVSTLDIAVWDNGSSKIVSALNNAYTRGVQVRYISSTNSLNTALSALNSSIPLLKRNAGLTTNVMHNKFIIADNTKILSGSMNFGNGSIYDDYNNIIIINNANLAQNYTLEFNEMWGSNGAQPNTTNSKFGPAKTDNTIHSFNIGSSVVESYFSPTDGTTAKIINAINSADYTLDIALFTFTNNDLGDAVIAAKNRGVVVRCIIENENYIGSEFNSLLNAGILIKSHLNVANDFHHKYCIIDAQQSSSDPIVVTGSHNWSNSAEEEYDENTLIIHDQIIANQYLEEFSMRFSSLVGIREYSNEEYANVFPNPNDGHFKVNTSLLKSRNFEIVDTFGRVVFTSFSEKANQDFFLNLENGIYFLKIDSEQTSIYHKIIIQK